MEKLSPLIHKSGFGCCKINETKENSPLKLRIIPLKGPDMLLLGTSSRSFSSQGVLFVDNLYPLKCRRNFVAFAVSLLEAG